MFIIITVLHNYYMYILGGIQSERSPVYDHATVQNK